MTRRRQFTVVGAVLVAAVGVLARPFLPGAAQPRSGPTSATAAPPVPSALIEVATRAATAAVACDAPTPSPSPIHNCGRLVVSQTEAFRVDASHVTVEIVGQIDDAETDPAPVAVRVELTPVGARWTATVTAP